MNARRRKETDVVSPADAVRRRCTQPFSGGGVYTPEQMALQSIALAMTEMAATLAELLELRRQEQRFEPL
ncbi:MAG TPA: hypothetical protein VFA60_00240 [Terriglobales bacterium]|nr:hypothetical protein [Terriglobales bacterium]